MHAANMIMSHQSTERNEAAFFRWRTVISNRSMTTDTIRPETTMIAARAAPNQPSVRCTPTLRTRTKADCTTNNAIQAEKAAALKPPSPLFVLTQSKMILNYARFMDNSYSDHASRETTTGRFKPADRTCRAASAKHSAGRRAVVRETPSGCNGPIENNPDFWLNTATEDSP